MFEAKVKIKISARLVNFTCQALIEKIESSCKKFDHSHKGSLTADEYFNVLKLQNGIDISKDEVYGVSGVRKEKKYLVKYCREQQPQKSLCLFNLPSEARGFKSYCQLDVRH